MPRTALENAKIRDQRRQDLLNVCLELFSRQGFEAVTINDIESVHAGEPGKQVFRSKEQEKCDMDMPRIHLPSHTRRL